MLLLESSELAGDGCCDGGGDGVEGPGKDAEVADEGLLRWGHDPCSHQQGRRRGRIRCCRREKGSERSNLYPLARCPLWVVSTFLVPLGETKIQSSMQEREAV